MIVQEFTVNFPLVVRLDDEPDHHWPHEVGYRDSEGDYFRLDSADDAQLKRMRITKPSPTLRRGDVMRGKNGYHEVVNDLAEWADDWHKYFTIVAHVDLDGEVTP